MRKILYSTMVICLLMALTGLPAYGYGGGGGGGEGEGDPTSGMGPSTSGGSIVPAGFTPIDIDFVSPAPPPELSSVGPTRITNETRELSEEERQQLAAAFNTLLAGTTVVVVMSGGVAIGYYTAAAGWTTFGQAAAGATYSGVTTYILSDEDAGEQAAIATIQDFAVGFIPVPPPAQAAISYGITKVREQIPARPYQTPRERLEYIADPRPRPLH